MFTKLVYNFRQLAKGRPMRKFLLRKQPHLPYINAYGLNEKSVLAELYNNAKPYGMGIFQYKDEVMSPALAKEILIQRQNWGHVHFDYIDGRPIKTSFEYFPDIMSKHYDSYNGVAAMQKCIDNVRNGTPTITIPRKATTDAELQDTLDWLNKNLKFTHLKN
jgi:hypothetical protein